MEAPQHRVRGPDLANDFFEKLPDPSRASQPAAQCGKYRTRAGDTVCQVGDILHGDAQSPFGTAVQDGYFMAHSLP